MKFKDAHKLSEKSPFRQNYRTNFRKMNCKYFFYFQATNFKSNPELYLYFKFNYKNRHLFRNQEDRERNQMNSPTFKFKPQFHSQFSIKIKAVLNIFQLG